MKPKLLIIGICILILCGTVSAEWYENIETDKKIMPFSIWFWQYGETHYQTGSAITWKYEAVGSSDLNPLNNMDINIGQNYDLFVVHYIMDDDEFKDIESTINYNILHKFSGQVHGGGWWQSDMNWRIKQELFGSGTYSVQPYPSTASWQLLNRIKQDYTQDIDINLQTTKDIEVKHVISVVCMHNGNFPHNNMYCEVAHKYYKIYNCGACTGTGEVCPLNYIPKEYVETYFQKYGERICYPKGEVVGGLCVNIDDCKNLVQDPEKNLGTAAHKAYHYMPIRCEKEDPSDVAGWMKQYSMGGGFGTCELGAKTPDDCEILGDPWEFHLLTTDGYFYDDLSGWGVKDEKCVLGECGTFSNCYDLYNSVHYECTPMYLDSQVTPSIGICEQVEWTGAQIQALCEDKFGAPESGYAWYVDQEGNCYEDQPFESQCDVNGNGEECGCKSGEVSACLTVITSKGTLGVCSCEPSGPPVTTHWCGDGICNIDEDEDICPEDCLDVEPPPPGPGPIIPEKDWVKYGIIGIIVILIAIIGLKLKG